MTQTHEAPVAVVTGASRGAGKGIAIGLGEKGMTVFVTGRSVDHSDAIGWDGKPLAGTIHETAAAVTAAGGRGIAVACDHADDAQIAALFDRVRAEGARRIAAPGQVFSRIHVDDLAAGLAASIARPRAGGIYNLCDDEPCSNSEVLAHAARLLGLEPPPEVPLAEAALSPAGRRFYAESKRVSNARAKAELGWRPMYPTYREGLAAVLAAGG